MPSKFNFKPEKYFSQLKPILKEIDELDSYDNKKLQLILRKYPKDNKGYFSKSQLIVGYQALAQELQLKTDEKTFVAKIKKKPIRTLSGVTPVTVLTKPFPCPGKCIFCPNDVRMPKSYLSDEPGAQRATKNSFDPYLQAYNRLLAYQKNGHSTDKIEIIILGGTWSFYPETYQIWFIKRCFDALNDFGSGRDNREKVKTGSNFAKEKQDVQGKNFNKTYNQSISEKLVKLHGKTINDWETATWEELEIAHKTNETSKTRSVGLVIETRPDHISQEEVIRVRRLGCTKTQIGFQSLNDHVLSVNNRGHDVAATRKAMKLLRAAGFKIHGHWMANLHGSSPDEDIKDYQKMFSDPDFKPDELKIYPCSLIETAELMDYYERGEWAPYTHQELLKVVTQTIKSTPQYCRLTRVIRDIPGSDIVVGNKKTNFRQIAEQELASQNITSQDIRAREIKDSTFDPKALKLDEITYKTSTTTEHFLQYVTPTNQIVGFLRLSLPSKQTKPFIQELANSAIIREIHVYGQATNLGAREKGQAQHLGLGTKLFKRSIEISQENNFQNLAVISAIGTRQYYRKLGFTDGKLYQHYKLT